MKYAGGLAAAAMFAGGLFLLRSEYERDQLVTDRYEVRSPKIKNGEKTFVFLTDLHDKEFGTDNERLLEAVREAKPDAVLVGGDMMVAKGKGDLAVSLKLMKALSGEFPVFHASGNHESRMQRETNVYGDRYLQYREALRGMGVTFLSDRSVPFGEDIMLCGLDLPPECYRPGRAFMRPGYPETVLGKQDPERFTILMAHSPMFFHEYAAWGADLTLAGHFHGGTIRLPVLGGVMTPQFQFFYPWCAGFFSEENGRQMIVGRGLGTHSINIRFCNKPQIVVVNVKK